ncbi:MAG: leukotoxin LktA family filamentous adhesin [Alphaproteobacteria bacterium]|nr:leukotoxin LktA family filamentous adhesin [Alphaproteobacteria bacterium]
MKYSRSAITQLTRWYRQVLIKCAILNAAVMAVSFGTPALASDITGVTPDGNTYNIEGAKFSGATQFRQYDNFKLDDGDIANLIYKSGYDKFVNLVDSQVNINGIVNTMRGNNFFNGHAIFVSPNGIVIGASGVLNVGSLTLATPSQSKFDAMKNAYNGDTLSNYEVGKDKYKEILTDSHGNVVINGKIMARGDVEVYGDTITVKGTSADKAGIVAGVKNQNSAFTNKAQAEQVFNSLVNSNIKQANSFSLEGGKLKLVASTSSKANDTAGNIKAEIDIKNANLGADEIDISAKAEVDRQERIDLAQAIVNIENSSITSNIVSATADASQNKSVDLTSIEDGVELIKNTLADLFDSDKPGITSLWGTAGKAEAEVNIKSSVINAVKTTGDKDANSIIINASASSTTSENANLLTPTILDFITNSDEAKISEYFSNDIYSGFEGAKSSATVNVDRSVLSAKGTMGIDITSMASSELKTDQAVISFIMPFGLYGVGTETISKTIVKNSLLNSNLGRVNVDAISTNIHDITVSNSSLLQLNIERSWLAVLLNNNITTKTESLIENSIVNATFGGLQVFATNLANSNVNLDLSADTGLTQEGSGGAGNSGAAVVGVLNRSDNDVSAIIKDITVNTYGNVSVMADSLNITGNSASASTYDYSMQRPATFEGGIKDKVKALSGNLNINIFDKIKGINTVPGTKETLLQGGGAFVWNVTDNNTTAKIENSTINNTGKANNVTVQATTIDLMKNNTYAESAGEEKIGLGLAVIYNDETNTTTANIDGSTVNAKSVLVDAQTELPMNMGQLSFGLKLPFKIKGVDTIQIGGNFASEANGKWDISLADPINVNYDDPDFDLSGTLKQNVLTTYENLKPKAKMSGFFNNLSKTQTKASTAAIAGSVVYNEVKNNTTADITNESKIMLADGGSLIVNAVNSVIGYNAAGMIDFLIKQINYKIPGQPDYKYQPEVEAGTFGLGFNFLWNDYTNDATAKIENSSVIAPNGSVDVRSATEQAYITITMTGGKAKSVGIDGSIHRQILEGTTLASISNTTKEEKAKNIISAKTVNVNAGKAKVRTAGGAMSRITPKMIKEDKEKADDDETKLNLTDAVVWYLSRNAQRDAEETITNIIAQGAWTTQSSGGENSSSVGIAVGASVNVTDIDRSVKAEINNYVMSADDVTVDSDSLTQSLNIEIAAAFSGGVDKDPADSTKKTKKITEEDEEDINKKLKEENSDENTDDNPLPKPNDGEEDDNLPNPKNPGELSDYEYEGLKAMGYSDDEIEQIFDNNYNSQFYQNKPNGMTNAKYRELVQAGYSDETINYYQGMVDGGATEDEIQQYLNTVGGNVGGRNPGGVSDYIYYNLRQMGFTDEEIESAFSNNGGNTYPNKPADMANETYLKLRQQNYTDEEIEFYQGMRDSGMTDEEVQDYFYNHSHSPYVNKPLNMDNETYLNMREANYTDEEIWTYQGMIDGGMSVDEAQTELNALNYSNKPTGMSNDKYRELRKYYTDEEIWTYQGMIDGGATDEDARIQLNNNQMYPGKPVDMSVEKYRELSQLGYSDEYINYYQGMIDSDLDEETVNNYFINNAPQNNQSNKYPMKPEGMSDATYEELVAKGISDNRILHYQILIDQGYSPNEALKIATAIRSDGKNPGGLTDEQYRILHDENGMSDQAIEEYFGSMSEEERNEILGGGQQPNINPYPNKPAGMTDEKYQSLHGEGFSDAEIKVFQELLDAGLTENQIMREMRGGNQNNSGNSRLDNLSQDPNPNNPGGISDWLYQFYKDGGFTDKQIRMMVADSDPQQGADNNLNALNSLNNFNAANYLAASQDIDSNLNSGIDANNKFALSSNGKSLLLKSDAQNDGNNDNLNVINDYIKKDPTGGAVNNPSSAFSLSAAGAVNVTNDDTKVESSINYSNINAKKSVTVDADRENKMLNISGGVAGSKKIGAGAAVNVYKQGGTVKSYVDSSNVTFKGETPKLDVTADNKNGFINIAIGVGAATNDEQNSAGFKAVAGGSASANVLKPEIDTYINSSTIGSNGGKINAKLEAKNDLDIYNIAGGGSYSSGSSAGVSAGAALNYNNINNTIHSYVKDSTLNDINNLDIKAQAENDLMEFAVAGAILTGTSGSGLGIEFAGSANIDYIHDVISAQTINSTVTADNDVNVNAESDSENLQVAGSFDYSSAKTGVGVNGSVDVNQYENNIFAQIDADSKILKANNVTVSARSEEKANVIPVGLSVSTDKNLAMLAATVGVNIIDNSVRAYIRGDIGTDENKVNNINVNAYDETTLYTRGGTLAIAAADTVANVGGSFNRDLISKTVEAKIGREDYKYKDDDGNEHTVHYDEKNEIKAAGNVSVAAASVNSLGGTKNSSGVYERDEITAEGYNDTLMQKGEDGNYSGLNYDNSFENWNMFYNFAIGAKVSVSGAVIVKTIEDAIKAEVTFADIAANNLSLMATDRSVSNIVAGQVSASSNGAVGAQVIVTNDGSDTSSLISNNSNITLGNKLEMASWNRKDSNRIVVAADASAKFAGAVNVLHNIVEDTNTAKIANSTVNAGEIKINADEDINASDIVVSAAGSKNLAIAVAPVINYYGDSSDETDEAKKKGKTLAEISGSTINDAAITMQANTDIDTRDIVVGAGFAMQGVSGTGVAVKNNNNTITKAVIDSGSIVDTAKNVILNADSTIDFNNWLVGVAAGGQGVALAGNVIINEITSVVETSILDSKIKKAGNIVLNTNKDKRDEIDNHSIGVSATLQGVSVSGLVSYNVYNNKNFAKIDNTAIDSSDSIDVQAFSNKEFYDLAVGVAATIKGGAAGVSAVVHNVDSTVQAYIDAKSQKINTLGNLIVKASDNTLLDTTGVNVAGGLVAIGGNINLYYSDSIVTAETTSSTDGQINAKSADVSAVSTHSTDTSKVGVVVGAGALAADVTVMRLGKVPAYTGDDEASKVDTAVDTTKTIYNLFESDGHYSPSSSAEEKETGTIARVKGNLKTTDDINIKSKTTLKGKGDNDTVDLGYVNVNVTGITAAGNVKNIKFSNKTIAGIVDGNVESKNGGITVDAESHAKTKIHGTAVDVTGVVVTYASDIINNSSETIAQIGGNNKNTTVNAKDDITVKSYSESKAEVDTTHVMVSTGDFAGVDIVDLQDSNHAYAQITGNTNINNNASKKDADGNLKTDELGKLTIHATSDTELKSENHTTKVQITQVYTGNKSNVSANTETKALLKDTIGTVNTKGLDIITDYKTMRAYQETGVVRVVAASAAAQATSGAKMNADFTSGIDSLTGLTIDNVGKTKIETAKALISGDAGKIKAESEASSVEVSGLGAYAGTFANAENTAKSQTYLKAKEHKADSLDINSYLNSKAYADVDSTKVTVIVGVNSIGFDAKDTSNLDLVMAGTNTITGNAIINAIHNSDIKSSLYGFNFGLVGSGQRIRIDADLNSSTTGSLGGDFNAGQAAFDFQTTRNSVTDISTGSGGIINVNDDGSSETSNRLRGNSVLTVDGLKTDKDVANNNITINNTSTNTFDTISKHGSGGVVNVSTSASHAELNTSTTTNVKNADINSNDTIAYNVTNNTIVADSGSNNGGGVVSVLHGNFSRSYTSGAYLNLENSEIRANDINMNTLSNIKSKDNKTFYYDAGGGGLVSVSDVDVDNTLTQTSQIDLRNSSKLYAENDAKLEVKTGSWFKQFSDNDNRGFVGAPSADIELNETNTNKISLDSSSLIKADNQTIFNFDSNNTLSSEAVSEAYGFAAPAEAYSYLRLTVNNELNNSGSITAGKLVDVNYMNNSYNDLYNRARTESTALVADTEEGGYLTKTVNNKLIVPSGAEIVSNKDIEVSYSEGSGSVFSKIIWETNSGWGLISDDDYWYSDYKYINPSLELNGKMVAGEGNRKYIVIKKDGSIDEEKTQGFSADAYTLEGGELADGATIKEQRLNSIEGKITSAEEILADVTAQKEVLDSEKAIYVREKTSAENIKADFKELVDGEYTLLNIEVAEGKTISAFEEQIQNDIQSQIVGDGADKITAEKYTLFKEKSDAKIKEIVEANKADPEKAVNVYSTLSAYWANDDSLGLTDAQKATVKTAFDAVQGKLGISTNKKFMTYTAFDGKKYAGVTNPTTIDNIKTCDELKGLDTTLANAAEKIDALDIKITNYGNIITDLNSELAALRNQKTKIENTDVSEFAIVKGEEYSILFNDITTDTARIKLDGMTNNNLSGLGIFNIAAAGVKVENYSTRSVIFNNIDLGSAHQSGLIIGDKNFGEFVDSEKAVNGSNAYAYKYGRTDMFGHMIYDTDFNQVGTSGAHYVSSEDGTGFSGVIVNNYYDTANPFALNQNIPHPEYTADITFNGTVNTGGHQLSVFNDSGSITAKDFNPAGMSIVNLISTKGDVNLTSPAVWRCNGELNVFAANSVNISGNDVDIDANITAGYNKDLTLTITDEMLSDLLDDPVTGEKILINLGTTPWANEANNIKALYKDGQIYVYHINNPVKGVDSSKRGTVNINVSSGGDVEGNIKTYSGYQNIKIDNQTNKQLNVYNIANNKSDGGYSHSYTEDVKDNSETTAKIVAKADTQIISTGKLVLDGVIKNSFVGSNVDTAGALTVTANNGLIIKQQTDEDDNVIASIISAGSVDINTNSGNTDILGNILNTGNVSIDNTGTGALNVNGDVEEKEGNVKITNSNAGILNVTGNITDEKGDITVVNTGDKISVSGSITDKNGNISITNNGSKGAEFTATAKVSNTKGNTTVTNNKGDLTVADGAEIKNLESGNITAENNGSKFTLAGLVEHSGSGNINVKNSGNGALDITTTGSVSVTNGKLEISNSNAGALNIAGNVVNTKGKTTVANTSADGMKLATTGQIHNSDGNIEISNTGAKGIMVEGKVLADKQNIVITNKDSDLTIGELVSNNDDYVETADGNIAINQQNGNVLNGIIDTSGSLHQNADLGKNEQSYKTLLTANGDLTMNVTDGDIGYTDNARPGFTIDASTRDWTDSVNVNVSGVVNAQATNNDKTDNRLINLRAKDSDLNVQNITTDGNVILTAADWKQADVRPTPDDEAYFIGYSVLNAANNNDVNISGQNISVIASNNIGEKGKKLTYLQNTATDSQSSVSLEAENDLYMSGKANSGNETKIYQMISKHGAIDLDLTSNATIKEITSNKELIIMQKAQNLAIMNLGMPAEDTASFTDMLYPHDELVYGFDSAAPEKSVVPQYVNISVLDAVDTPERSDSNLKIYSMTVRGTQDENYQSDIVLMADNIYVNSAKAPDSDVSTKNNPNGYKQTQKTYSDAQFGGSGTVYEAKGINTFGEGKAIRLNISGVDDKVVNEWVNNPQRNDYEKQYSFDNIPTRFQNKENNISDYGFKTKNAVISMNDYADDERGVEFNTLYADNAYINTMDTNLIIHDSYINNYAEIRNGNRDIDSNRYLAVVDNDYRRLVPSNVQLYTQKTGSFGLNMDEKIKFHTMAPVVHYDWDKLVNTFGDENSFVRLGLKETEIRQKAKDYYGYYNTYVMPEASVAKYDVWKDNGLLTNVKIIELTRDSAIVVNKDNWQLGDEQVLNLMFDDVKAAIHCKVIGIDKHYATVKFLDMPASVYNKLAYRYLKMAEK